MKIYNFTVAALLLTFSVGCQSSSWKTALGSRFGRDKPSKLASEQESKSDDVQLIAGDKLNSSGRSRGSRSSDRRSLADRTGSGEDVNSTLQRGHKAEEAGQLKQAKMFYRQALDSDAKNPLAHHRLAIIADKEGEFRQAEEHYLNALSVKRNDPNLLSDLGYSFLLQNRRDESRYYLQKALDANPSHARALNNLGLLEARQGNYDGALAMFRKTGSERDAQAKLSELFPNGRPDNNSNSQPIGLAAGGTRNSLPRVTPAGGPAPWEQGASQNSIQTVGGAPVSPSIQPKPTAARPFPDVATTPQPTQPIGFNETPRPQSGFNPGLVQDKRPQTNSFASEPPRSNSQRTLDLGQQASESTPTLKMWPPSTNGQAAPAQQPDFPNAPDPTRLASDFGATGQQPATPFPQVGTDQRPATNPTTNNASLNSGYPQNASPRMPSTPPQIDHRQQAAMMGLNAGLTNAFPVTRGVQPQQPQYPAKSPANSVPASAPPIQFQPTAPTNPGNTAPPFPTQTTGQLGQPSSRLPLQPNPPTAPTDSRFRTAARPVSQPPHNNFQQQPAVPAQPYNQPRPQQYQQHPPYQPRTPQQPAGNGAYAQPQSQQYQPHPQQQQPMPTQQFNPQPTGTQYPPAQQFRGNYDTSRNTTTPQPFNPNSTYQQGR